MISLPKNNDGKEQDMEPYGQAYINGWRCIFNPYVFKKGKNKGKVQVYYRKGSGFKKKILERKDITLLEGKELDDE